MKGELGIQPTELCGSLKVVAQPVIKLGLSKLRRCRRWASDDPPAAFNRLGFAEAAGRMP